jgi:hypothetical protein
MASAIYYLPASSTLNAGAMGKVVEKLIIVSTSATIADNSITLFGANVYETANNGTSWTVDGTNGTVVGGLAINGVATSLPIEGTFSKVTTGLGVAAIAYIK